MGGLEIVLKVADRTFRLQRGQIYLIGKEKKEGNLENFIDLASENNVDSKHATVEVQHDMAFVSVVDLHSNAGTFINGKRLNSMAKVQVLSESVLRFGDVEGTLKINAAVESRNSSGFLDGLRNYSNISLSPEATPHQQSRKELKNNERLLFSEMSIPSPPVSQKKCDKKTTADALNLNVTTDNSFTVPETQFCEKRDSLLGANVSIAESDAGDINDSTSDDSFIPATQEVIETASSSNKSSILLPVNNPFNSPTAKDQTVDISMLGGSQFHICTQDFNEGVLSFDSDSSDLLGDVQCSLIIPRIVHDRVSPTDAGALPKRSPGAARTEDNCYQNPYKKSAEKCALNWEATTSTKDCIANISTERELLSCTPDLFDLPELALENANAKEIGGTDNVGGPLNGDIAFDEKADLTVGSLNSITATCAFVDPAKVVTGKSSATSSDGKCVATDVNADNEDDLLPTQIFAIADTGGPHEKTEDKDPAVSLPLSNKENMPIAVDLDVTKDATQIFTILHSGLPKSSSAKLVTSCKAPTDPKADDSLPATQIFPQQRKRKSAAVPVMPTKMCLNSTPLRSDEPNAVRNATSFFEDIDKSTKAFKDTFKKPESAISIRKASSASSTNTKTTVGATSQTNFEMLMCTPKFIKDIFEEYGSCSKESLISAKKKVLFGEDSEEEEDMLKLLSEPKVSHDFDKLLPHLRKQRTESNLVMHWNEQPLRSKSKIALIEKPDKKERHAVRERKSLTADVESQNKLNDTAGQGTKSAVAKSNNQTDRHQENKKKTINTIKQNKNEETVKPSHKSDQGNEKDIKFKEKTSKIVEKITRSESGSNKEKQLSPRRVTRQQSRCVESHENPHKQTKEKKPSSETGSKSRTSTSNLNAKSHIIIEEKRKNEIRLRSLSMEKEINVPSKPVKNKRSSHESNKAKSAKITERTEDTKRPTGKHTRGGKQRLASSRDVSEEKHIASDTNCRRQTRSRSATESQESNCSNVEPITSRPGHKRKTQISPHDNCKRLRHVSSYPNSSSYVPSSNSSGKASSKLKVTMTMVDSELFERLAQNSSDIWNVAKDPVESDVLIMDKGNRTYKFLIAMAKGIPILTSKWLESVNKTGKIVQSNEFFFMDAAFERRHKFSLLKSLEAARKKSLFIGYEFLMTTSILPTPSDMQAIVSCAGGTVHFETPAAQPNQKIYLISSAHDKEQWHKYRRANNQICIINTEGVMAAVMRQNVLELDANVFA